jgi:hypothetical protein
VSSCDVHLLCTPELALTSVTATQVTSCPSSCAQLLTKKSPNDILKLFNQQPQNALFAGSPAQVALIAVPGEAFLIASLSSYR